MNREIKFRAWNGNIMINFADFEFTNTGGFWGGNREVWAMQAFFGIGKGSGGGYWHSDFAEDVKLELMQFTGLKDKNGKDIYEGDIVKVDWNDARYAKHNVEVIWNEINLCWEIAGGCLTADNNHFEVIGNIFENPELKTGF